MQLGADKLFNMHMDEVTKLRLPPWLPLSDAQEMLIKTLQVCACALRPSSPPLLLNSGVTTSAREVSGRVVCGT